MNKSQLEKSVGGISQTEKMPCASWSLSAFKCNVGGKLANIKNSVCYGCYAMKGNYLRYKDNLSKSYKNKSPYYRVQTWQGTHFVH